MKPSFLLATPPLVFVTAAILAGLTCQSIHSSHDEGGPAGLSPRKRAAVFADSNTTPTGIPAVLSEMERSIIHFPPPEKAAHDATGMEAALLTDERYTGFCGSGMPTITYSGDWARENPQGMFEWLIHQGMVSDSRRQSLARTLFSEWAEQDMTAALAAVTRISHTETRAQALFSTLEILCQKEPAKARELLIQNLNLLQSIKKIDLGIGPGKARTDLLLSLPPGEFRTSLLAENLWQLSILPYDGNGALATELWNALAEDQRRALVAAGLRESAYSSDIRLTGLETLVREHVEASNDPEKAMGFLSRYGEAWAKRDPGDALSWAMARLKGKERMDQSLKLIQHATSKNFDETLRVWQSLPEGTLRNQAAKILSEAAPADRQAEKDLLGEATSKPIGEGGW